MYVTLEIKSYFIWINDSDDDFQFAFQLLLSYIQHYYKCLFCCWISVQEKDILKLKIALLSIVTLTRLMQVISKIK